MKKPILIIDGYETKKQQHGLFKIIEYSHYSNEPGNIRKRTIYKNLTLSEAENITYQLEK